MFAYVFTLYEKVYSFVNAYIASDNAAFFFCILKVLIMFRFSYRNTHLRVNATLSSIAGYIRKNNQDHKF